MRLTQAQIDFFHQEGYLAIEQLFDETDLQPLIDELNSEIERRAQAMVAAGELSRTYAEEGFETRLARITAENEKLYWTINSGQLAGPGIFSLISNPKLLDVAESLVGSEIIASSAYRIRPKVPGFGHGVVPWHQDSGYFEPYCDKSLILTVWVPLVDATPERGCLEVMPRAHRGEVVRHARSSNGMYLEIPSSDLPEGSVVTTPIPKGGALLLTNRTPHRSTENISDCIRWSVDIRYQNAALPTNYPLDDADRPVEAEEGVPLACYPPEADFLVRSKTYPARVVTDWRDFNRLRTGHERVGMTQRWS